MLWFSKKPERIGCNRVPKAFFNRAELLLNPYFLSFGFTFTADNLRKRWYAARTFRKADQFVTVELHVNQYDGPPFGNVILGIGDDSMLERDWNSVALWRLARRSGEVGAAEYMVNGWTLDRFFDAVRADLDQFGRPFLEGPTTEFVQLRAEQASKREPYKVFGKDENGVWVSQVEAASSELKKRFSQPG